MGVNKVSILIRPSLTILVRYGSPKGALSMAGRELRKSLGGFKLTQRPSRTEQALSLSGSSSGPWCVKQAMGG